jgi:hypothetical protein
MVNNTLCYLLARVPISTMGFSGHVATSSMYLSGPGGQAGDGFPLPRDGYLTAIYLWDGTKLAFDTGSVAFTAGTRLSVYCQSAGSNFSVRVRLNGSSSGLEATEIPFNANLMATVEFALLRE